MKGIVFISLLFAIGCSTSINQEQPSQYYDYDVMLGEVDWQGLTQAPNDQWFTPNYLNYQVDTLTLAGIEENLEEIEIFALIGTWCEDSQIQLPQFYKILDHLNYNLNNMQVEAIDRYEDGLVFSPLAKEHKASHTPEFIFYKNGVELGRISEYPKETLEKDIVKILSEVRP